MLLSQSNHFPSKQSRKVRNLRSERNCGTIQSEFPPRHSINLGDWIALIVAVIVRVPCARQISHSLCWYLRWLITHWAGRRFAIILIYMASNLTRHRSNIPCFSMNWCTRASIGLRLLNRIINFNSTRVRTSFCFGKQL